MEFSLNSISIFLVTFICAIHTLNPKMQYYGDIQLLDYFPQMCSNLTSKYSVSFIENLAIKEVNLTAPKRNDSQMRTLFRKIECNHNYFSNIRISDIVYSSLTDDSYNHKKILVIYDFTNYQITPEGFNKILSVLSNLFIICFECFPFLALFQMEQHKLSELTRAAFGEVGQKFQATLVSVDANYQASSAIHLRPILDGCVLYPGVFEPKTELDFTRLRTQYSNCNLNGQTLNVSMKEYPGMCEFTPDSTEENFKFLGFTMETQLLALLQWKYNFNAKIFLNLGNDMISIYRKQMSQVYYGVSIHCQT